MRKKNLNIIFHFRAKSVLSTYCYLQVQGKYWQNRVWLYCLLSYWQHKSHELPEIHPVNARNSLKGVKSGSTSASAQHFCWQRMRHLQCAHFYSGWCYFLTYTSTLWKSIFFMDLCNLAAGGVALICHCWAQAKHRHREDLSESWVFVHRSSRNVPSVSVYKLFFPYCFYKLCLIFVDYRDSDLNFKGTEIQIFFSLCILSPTFSIHVCWRWFGQVFYTQQLLTVFHSDCRLCMEESFLI